jgi:hypothetical protein
MRSTCVRSALALSFILAMSACNSTGSAPDNPDEVLKVSMGTAPTLDPSDTSNLREAFGGGGSLNTIVYHGGPVIHGQTNIYYIWYGNWTNNTATTLLPFLAQNIGGSSYFNINTTYYDKSGTHVSNAVGLAGQINDAYSQGTSLTDAGVQLVVTNAINGGRLPYDANGVYFVLTSADVAESSGFCSKYCGWHTYASTALGPVNYAFIGNPDRCPTACEAQSVSPNGNAGADGMASIISHELEESATDPQLNAWYDRRGEENADKCAWTFGSLSTASNGSRYNVVLNGVQYLIQQNWVNKGSGYCSMTF